MPPGGQVPVEPVKLPCSNPADCAEADEMIALIRGPEWSYSGWLMSQYADPGKTGAVYGYTAAMYNAWKHKIDGAWPPPGFENGVYINPANWHTIVSKPS